MKTLTLPLIAALLLSFMFVDGYAKTDTKGSQKSEIVEANVWITDSGEKRFICPVMGGEGVVDSTTLFTEVDGKRYYHCCAGCPDKFKANPSKYLKSFVVPGNVIKVDKDGKHYRCPVSGEMGSVTKDTPYSDYNGKRYYFCCSNCKTNFDEKPHKYMKSEGKKSDMKMKHKH